MFSEKAESNPDCKVLHYKTRVEMSAQFNTLVDYAKGSNKTQNVSQNWAIN
jgi:hypothetical protein